MRFYYQQIGRAIFLDAPIVVIVEAKNESIKNSLPQCIASIVAARIYNHQENNIEPNIYRAVTTGDHWKFLELENRDAFLDIDDYYINDPGQRLGILLNMVEDMEKLKKMPHRKPGAAF